MHRFLLAACGLFVAAGLLPIQHTPPTQPAVAQAQAAAVAVKAVCKVAPPVAVTQVKPATQQPEPKPAPKAPLLKLPEEVHLAPGDLAQVLIETEPGVQLHYQWVGPKGGQAFREYDPDPTHVSYQVLGRKPGVFYLVVFAMKDGQVAKAICTITVDGPTPPGPGPGPGPRPPAPADPLVGQLQTLYTADPAAPAEKAPVKDRLARLYSGMAQQLGAGQYQTVAEASEALKNAAAAANLGTYLLALRKVCAAEVSRAVGPAPAAKLEPALRATLVSTFTRLATALDAVK